MLIRALRNDCYNGLRTDEKEVTIDISNTGEDFIPGKLRYCPDTGHMIIRTPEGDDLEFFISVLSYPADTIPQVPFIISASHENAVSGIINEYLEGAKRAVVRYSLSILSSYFISHLTNEACDYIESKLVYKE